MNRSIPPVFSSSDGQHGDAADHHDHAPGHRRGSPAFSSAALARVSTTAAANAPIPTWTPKPTTPTTRAAIAASVTTCRRATSRSPAGVGRRRRRPAVVVSAGRTAASRRRRGSRPRRPAALAARLYEVDLPLEARHPHPVHQAVGDDPRRRDRRRAPATQPWATMIVIRNGGILARSATAIASGRDQRGRRDVARADRRDRQRQAEEQDRDQPGVPPAAPHRRARHPVERAVALRLREQQRHPHQRQEQVGRETRPGPRLDRRIAAPRPAPGRPRSPRPSTMRRGTPD